MSLRPKASNFVSQSVPEDIRDNNPLFVQFLKYYNEWNEAVGNAGDFLHNIEDYRDIDKTTEFFSTHIMQSLLKILPPSVSVNKKTLTKNIRQFFNSKGTEDSFKFIMNAIFNEVVEVKWAKDYLFRASSSNQTFDTHLSVSSVTPFTDIIGSEIFQLVPFARAVVESNVTSVFGSDTINWLTLKANTISGNFIPGSNIRILDNRIPRTSVEITTYYTFESVNSTIVNIRSPINTSTTFVGQVLRQVGSNARAIISSVTSTFDNGYRYTLNVKDMTGTWTSDDIYIVSPDLESRHYTKNDFRYGTVGYSITDIDIIENSINDSTVRNIGYKIGQPVEFQSGSGTNVSATISSITTGGLDTIDVIQSGQDYSVGDIVYHDDAFGQDFTAKVKTIDGIGAEAQFTMEVDALQIVGNTANVVVGDTFAEGTGDSNSLLITVTGVDSSGNITTFSYTNRGRYNVTPTAWNCKLFKVNSSVLLLEDGSTLLEEDGSSIKLETSETVTVNLKYRILSCVLTNNGRNYTSVTTSTSGGCGTGAQFAATVANGVITNIPITTAGTGYTKAYAVIQNAAGIGFIGRCNISSGGIASITILDGGVGYTAANTVTILGDGASAVAGVITVANGVIKSVTVLHGGTGYPYDTTISYSSGAGATLTPTIVDGVITSVAASGGSGYTTAGTFTVSAGTASTVTSTLSGTGEIVDVTIESSGNGYYPASEITPLSITVNTSTGSGALIMPILDSGRIVFARVIRTGTGYLPGDTIVISGGSGSGASMSPVFSSGSLIDITIISSGLGYKYGTSLFVIGDGSGFVATPNVDTGISNAVILNGGTSYLPASTTLTVTDTNPAATGAVLVPVLQDGVLVDVIIQNPGLHYQNPTVTVNGVGTSAVVKVKALRNISSVTISNHGTHYSGADIFVFGDGYGARITPIINKFGEIKTISATAGSGYTSTPILSAVDSSSYGSISSVEIINQGYGFKNITPLYLTSTFGTGAYLIGYGSSVGSINGIEFSEFGTGYNDIPRVSFPVIARVKSNDMFKIGETVTVKGQQYHVDDGINGILQENGDKLLLEDGFGLLYDYDVFYSRGPMMVVSDYDFATNTITFVNASEDIDFISEDGRYLVSETGAYLEHEDSDLISAGDVIVGQTSGAQTTIVEMFRASGMAVTGAVGYNNRKFVNVIGLLNNRASKLSNNFNIHDYAYSIKSGLDQKIYEYFIKKSVHPAGYKMFGEVEMRLQDNTNLKVTITKVPVLFSLIITLYGLGGMPQNTYEWHSYSWLDENKFKVGGYYEGQVMMEDGFGLLLEDGYLLLGDSLGTYYPGSMTGDFDTLTFANMDPLDPEYNINGFNMDFSAEIDVYV